MNFTEYLKSLEDPLYQVEGKTPKCKKGYKWDKNIGGCIPIGSPTKDEKKTPPENYDGYGVWGSNGMDGGYALAEPNPSIREAVYAVGRRSHTSKEEDEREEKRLKKEKDRLMYGKNGSPKERLSKGQYKIFDKASGEWVLAQALPNRNK